MAFFESQLSGRDRNVRRCTRRCVDTGQIETVGTAVRFLPEDQEIIAYRRDGIAGLAEALQLRMMTVALCSS